MTRRRVEGSRRSGTYYFFFRPGKVPRSTTNQIGVVMSGGEGEGEKDEPSHHDLSFKTSAHLSSSETRGVLPLQTPASHMDLISEIARTPSE